jgi:hypothetical protein
MKHEGQPAPESMTRSYVRVMALEVIVLALLWWFSRAFA